MHNWGHVQARVCDDISVIAMVEEECVTAKNSNRQNLPHVL